LALFVVGEALSDKKSLSEKGSLKAACGAFKDPLILTLEFFKRRKSLGERVGYFGTYTPKTKDALMWRYTDFFNAAPALNLTTFLALIVISFPVWGFRPFLALRLATEKVPNPIKAILSPFLSAPDTALVKAVKAFPAAAFETPVSFAILSINSAFVIFFFLHFKKLKN
jgi:hypothetical protein